MNYRPQLFAYVAIESSIKFVKFKNLSFGKNLLFAICRRCDIIPYTGTMNSSVICKVSASMTKLLALGLAYDYSVVWRSEMDTANIQSQGDE